MSQPGQLLSARAEAIDHEVRTLKEVQFLYEHSREKASQFKALRYTSPSLLHIKDNIDII